MPGSKLHSTRPTRVGPSPGVKLLDLVERKGVKALG